MTLDLLPVRQPAFVVDVSARDRPEWQRQLLDLGFVPGEPLQVLRRSVLGRGRVVVRVGTSTYGLRREEAACVQVQATPARA